MLYAGLDSMTRLSSLSVQAFSSFRLRTLQVNSRGCVLQFSTSSAASFHILLPVVLRLNA